MDDSSKGTRSLRSRCVCGDWKRAIDGRRLLRADLLPLSVGGIFLNFWAHRDAEYVLPPQRSTVSGSVIHLYPCTDYGWCAGMVKDHHEVYYEDKCLGIEETFVYTPCKLDGHPYVPLAS
ncbi:hypothetical protein C2845_PM02G41230 [Panicum miliaceum]|uniref:Uncharacterized protein n=1 Tax=Panicum miliaceum TaxID=4540 RepID=A0A3L6SBR7_PANMI|nr:hypothetical protein C2845_PM02G41230 [Panicum miliaceum]